MPAPRPGRPVRGSRTGRPILALLDWLGRRGTLRLLWELRGGALPFRELQRRSELSSPNLVSARLGEGLEMRILERDAEGRYALTPRGRELGAVLLELDAWAKDWARAARRRGARGKERSA